MIWLKTEKRQYISNLKSDLVHIAAISSNLPVAKTATSSYVETNKVDLLKCYTLCEWVV